MHSAVCGKLWSTRRKIKEEIRKLSDAMQADVDRSRQETWDRAWRAWEECANVTRKAVRETYCNRLIEDGMLPDKARTLAFGPEEWSPCHEGRGAFAHVRPAFRRAH